METKQINLPKDEDVDFQCRKLMLSIFSECNIIFKETRIGNPTEINFFLNENQIKYFKKYNHFSTFKTTFNKSNDSHKVVLTLDPTHYGSTNNTIRKTTLEINYI